MPEIQLNPDGQPVELKQLGFVIVSKTMAAEVVTIDGSAPGMRSGGPGLTDAVMRSADIRELGTVVLQDQYPQRDHEKEVALLVPAGQKDDGRILMYFDEDGGVSFHAPKVEHEPIVGIRAPGEQMLRFDVPIREPKTPPSQKSSVRGVGGMIAKKVLKVIGWKVLGAAARMAGPPLVRLWENKCRPLRVLDWDTLFVPKGETSIDKIPTADKSLLFVHGTFSRVAAAFSGIPEDQPFKSALQDSYRGHIYGFDHATLATGVATNVMQLYDRLSPGVHNFDIVCHSRGGLVARALRDLNEVQLKDRFRFDAERGNYGDDLKEWGEQWHLPADVNVNVNRVVFAGTPNSGTVLAQPTHLKTYLETLMTATNLLPELVDVTVDAILAAAKLLINDVVPQLPGLDDQQPSSTLLPLLEGAPGAADAAIQAEYEPPEGLRSIMCLADTGMDFVFGGEKNDLVVPTDGVSRWVSGKVPAPRLLNFRKDKGVFHSSLFEQRETRDCLLEWLA